MRVADLIRQLQTLPPDAVVHVHHGGYTDNRHPLNPDAVCVRKCGVEYTMGWVEGVFLE